MKISIIVAMTDRRVIGRGGRLPWHLPADLRRFKQLTMGHHLVMGRKTYESIGRPLPGRTSIVLTRQANYQPAGALVAAGLDEALELAPDDDVFIIGGAEVYRMALPRADRLLVTRVEADVEGDTFFPEFSAASWKLQCVERHEADARNPLSYSFETYERV